MLISLGLEGCSKEMTPPPSAGPMLFTDVTESVGLSGFRYQTGAFGAKWMPETYGGGGAFLDYDGDDHLDLLLVGGAFWEGHGPAIPALRLFRFENGRYREVTDDVGLSDVHAYGMGITIGDVDGDGDSDVFLTAYGRNRILRNDAGHFVDATDESGLEDEYSWSTGAAFFDADRDGDLDLYYGNYVKWSIETDPFCSIDGRTKSYCMPINFDGVAGHFYQNTGDGHFRDKTKEAGLDDNPGKTLAVTSFDANHDGWPDLVVANDTERNLLYLNQKDGTFRDVGVASGIAYGYNGIARAGMGLDVGSVESVDDDAIVIGNFSDEMLALYELKSTLLYVDRAPVAGLGETTLKSLTFGLLLFDADLDKHLDLLLCNGHLFPEIEQTQDAIPYRQQAQLFLNDGTGSFVLQPAEGALAEPMVGRGAAFGDFDGDGDVDVLLCENSGPVHLWRNNIRPGPRAPSVLRIDLRGRGRNTAAVGARIRLRTGSEIQTRYVHTGASYLSSSEMTLSFGLGHETNVDSVTVSWPDGAQTMLAQIKSDMELRIHQGGAVDTIRTW